MKANIHPNYIVCKVRCACGNEFETISLRDSMRVDICSNCHPFYTGKQKFVDTAGRVQKFEKRFKWSDAAALTQATKKSPTQKKKQKVQKIGKIVKAEKKPADKAKKADASVDKVKKTDTPVAEPAPKAPDAPKTDAAPETKPEA